MIFLEDRMPPLEDKIARQLLILSLFGGRLNADCLGPLVDRLEEIGDPRRAGLARRCIGNRKWRAHMVKLAESALAVHVQMNWPGQVLSWGGDPRQPAQDCTRGKQHPLGQSFGMLDVKEIAYQNIDIDHWLQVGELHSGRFFSLRAVPDAPYHAGRANSWEYELGDLRFEKAFVADKMEDIISRGIDDKDFWVIFGAHRQPAVKKA